MTMLSRRDFAKITGGASLGVAFSGGVATAASSAAAVSPSQLDILPYVHPELRAAVKPLMSMSTNVLSAQTLPAFRTMAYAEPALAQPAVTERMIAGAPGTPDVRLVIINGKQDGSRRPAILHTHGGGFVAGTIKSSLRYIQEIALALDCVVVSVDYRLAPETRFTGSLEDNYAGLKWLYKNGAEIGADPTRIALLGESAGGGHAALLAIAARDRGEIPVIYQALIYPMLDDRTGSTVKTPPHMGAIIWTPEMNKFGWTSFLGVEAGSSSVPPAGVPARTANLKGLPRTFIAVGSIDLFVDEDIEYARRLVDSGIATELHIIPGGYHGFDIIPTPTLGKKFKATLVDALRLAFAGW